MAMSAKLSLNPGMMISWDCILRFFTFPSIQNLKSQCSFIVARTIQYFHLAGQNITNGEIRTAALSDETIPYTV